MSEFIKSPPQLVYPEDRDNILQAFEATRIPEANLRVAVSQLRYEAIQRGVAYNLKSEEAKTRKGHYMQLWLTTFLEQMRYEVPGFKHWNTKLNPLPYPYSAKASADGTVTFFERSMSHDYNEKIMELDSLTIFDDYKNPPTYTIWEIKISDSMDYINTAFDRSWERKISEDEQQIVATFDRTWIRRVETVKNLFGVSNVGYVVVSPQTIDKENADVADFIDKGGKIVKLPDEFNRLHTIADSLSDWEKRTPIQVPLNYWYRETM